MAPVVPHLAVSASKSAPTSQSLASCSNVLAGVTSRMPGAPAGRPNEMES